MIWPVTEAVAVTATRSGSESDFDEGMALLAELTSRLTAEFAIRSFLETNLDRSLAIALTWTGHEDEHVRRLATEGTRTRLPWGRRVKELTARPESTIVILDELYRMIRNMYDVRSQTISTISVVLTLRSQYRLRSVGCRHRMPTH